MATHEEIQKLLRELTWSSDVPELRARPMGLWELAPRPPKPEKNPCPCGSGQRIGECDCVPVEQR